MNFNDKITASIQKNNSLLCIGLDPDIEKLPQNFKSSEKLFEFNKAIIDATHDLVCAYKPNSAFYEILGSKGITILKKTIEYIHTNYPYIPVILDAKRGDIDSTAQKYAQSVFDFLKADAVTLNPYLGFDSIKPFLEYKEKGCIILCKTSNKSASDFQDLRLNNLPLYVHVAKKIIEWNNFYHNCNMVIGATWPNELKNIRKLAPEMFFLIPGIGFQGADLEKTMRAGLTHNKSGLIINSSRSILYASKEKDFANNAREKAIKIKDEINRYR